LRSKRSEQGHLCLSNSRKINNCVSKMRKYVVSMRNYNGKKYKRPKMKLEEEKRAQIGKEVAIANKIHPLVKSLIQVR